MVRIHFPPAASHQRTAPSDPTRIMVLSPWGWLLLVPEDFYKGVSPHRSILLAYPHGAVLSAMVSINPAFLGADQRLNDAGAGRQPVGADQDLALSVVDRADCERRAVFFGSKATRDSFVRYDGSGQQRGQDSSESSMSRSTVGVGLVKVARCSRR